jgi:hypothetical protein
LTLFTLFTLFNEKKIDSQKEGGLLPLTNNKVFLHARKSRNSSFEIENKALKHYKKGEKHFLVPSTNSILFLTTPSPGPNVLDDKYPGEVNERN